MGNDPTKVKVNTDVLRGIKRPDDSSKSMITTCNEGTSFIGYGNYEYKEGNSNLVGYERRSKDGE